jgi:phage terminase large subunit GpA-like protein
MADAATAYRLAFLNGLRPEDRGTVSEWADQFRVLSGVGCPEPGPWRTSRAPYLREPMDCLSSISRVRRVVLMFGSQLGKTEAGLNWLGSIIHWNPAPTLLVQPTLEMAKRLNRQRLEPFIRETPPIAERIPPPRARDSGNTAFLKLFPGGMFVLTGANSASAAQSMPAANLFADEVSSYPLRLDDKGDPLENFEARTANFPRGKTLITSTPGEAKACRVTKEFETRSDRRRFHVPCPACGVAQVLVWPQFKWDRPEGEVTYECAHCAERFEERHKSRMLPSGVWVPTAAGDGITAGFHLPGWYAPLGWISWGEIRDQFIRAKTDAELLKGWVNKRAAEAWRDEIENAFNVEGLAKRRQDIKAGNGYPVGVVPDEVVLITGGVDVQGGGGSVGERLVVTLWGWGRGEEGWHLGHWEIHGDPQQDEVWQQLDNIAATSWKRADGRQLKMSMGGIDDGGHAPHAVRNFCRSGPAQWVPMKGSGTKGRPIIGKGSAVDVSGKNKVVTKRALLLYSIGTDASITHLQGRIRNEQPGSGYLHLGQCSSDQFLAELFPWKRRARAVKGFTQYEWTLPPGAHDEGGDCTRMAYAALQLVARRYNRATMWDQLEQQVSGMVPSAGQARQPDPRQPADRQSGGWLAGGGAGGRAGRGWLGR